MEMALSGGSVKRRVASTVALVDINDALFDEGLEVVEISGVSCDVSGEGQGVGTLIRVISLILKT